MTGIICGTGSYAPSYVMDNNEIATMVDTNDEWIRERTGVAARHIIREETTVSMACEAAKRALDDAGTDAGEVDLIIVSTISSNVILPCAACEVQKLIGAEHATCYDMSAACSGFVLAYNAAQAYIAAGMYRTVLIIGSESLSNLTNWKDRGTCILFGDGAGAAVIKAFEERFYLPVTHSEGAKGEALTCLSRHAQADAARMTDAEYFMQMDGHAVFKFAVKRVPEVIGEVLEKNKVRRSDVAWYCMHQANRRIVESVAKRLDEPIEKFPMNLQEYGNTSSASIGILLDEMNRAGQLEKGQKIVLAGFGAGLTWGACIAEWRK